MIWLTRLNGDRLVINADMIETIESTPDTVITLSNGHRWIVAETPDEVIRRVVSYRRKMASGPRRRGVSS
ncbi:MAG: flagellar FlbD family protein [Bacillota bacterium]|nr:flagellar FlbD family protein [Bacillota bacterium]